MPGGIRREEENRKYSYIKLKSKGFESEDHLN